MVLPQFHAGFDVASATDFGLVLNSNFGGVPFGAGRYGGRCALFDNTGFGFKSLYRDVGALGMAIGFAYSPYTDSSGDFGLPTDIFRIEDSLTSTTLANLRTKGSGDKHLDLFIGASQFTTTAEFQFAPQFGPNPNWKYIEVEYTVGGDIKVYVDDVLDIDSNVTSDPTKIPNRIRWRWENFGAKGFSLDDVYISAASNVTGMRLGPIRIAPWLCNGNEITGFGHTGQPSNFQCINETWNVRTTPDLDSSFVQGTIPGLKDLYTLARRNDCDGRIACVATNIVSTAPSGDPSSIQTIVRADPTNSLETTIGIERSLSAVYQYWMAYSAAPPTFPLWRQGDVEKSVWGFRSGGTGITRTSTFWVDKLQSLRDVPFDCGQIGSYAFGR